MIRAHGNSPVLLASGPSLGTFRYSSAVSLGGEILGRHTEFIREYDGDRIRPACLKVRGYLCRTQPRLCDPRS